MVAVRAARPEDADAIAAIYRHAVEHTVFTFDLEAPSVATWRRRLEGAGDPFWVAERDGRVVGYAYHTAYRPKAGYARTRELSIYVAEHARGAGVGRALLDELVASARQSGVHVLLAVIAGDNPASFALHERLGFREVGHLKEVGLKFGRWVDTRYYQLTLAE